jgi:hypothetical protein
MSNANHIIIKDPAAIAKTIAEMESRGRLLNFLTTWARLLTLFGGYLEKAPSGSNRVRTATVWASGYDENDFFWVIEDVPTCPSDLNQSKITVLGGGLHFHYQNQTWSINT